MGNSLMFLTNGKFDRKFLIELMFLRRRQFDKHADTIKLK